MGRSNVIIVGSVVLAPLILGIESYLLFKAHHRRVRTAELTGSIEVSTAPESVAAVAQTPAVPVSAEPLVHPPSPRPNPASPSAEAPPERKAERRVRNQYRTAHARGR